MKTLHPRTKLTSLLAATCFALMPAALAVSPPPDGGYPNQNTAEGQDALFSLDSGRWNTAVGYRALYSATSAEYNTAVGYQALTNTTSGFDNTAVGTFALTSDTGSSNTAVGSAALGGNTTGAGNTAVGNAALNANATGSSNTAIGYYALGGYSGASGSFNTATGVTALRYVTTGESNTANGYNALLFNTEGSNNVAVGSSSLRQNTTAQNNTALGANALFTNTTGHNNTALGYNAGRNLTTGNNNIDIGNSGGPGESNILRIGKGGDQTNTYIAGISGVTVAGGIGVIVDSTGHLGTVTSSERFKDAITPMDRTSESILALKPVTFRYKHDLDPAGIPQFGLVAEQVEKVNPDLVARDEQGKPYTVRYEAVNAMLLNEFIKEHKKVEEQEATISQLKADDTNLRATLALQQATNAEQQKEIQALTAGLREQASRIQKVSDEMEAHKSTPQVVAER